MFQSYRYFFCLIIKLYLQYNFIVSVELIYDLNFADIKIDYNKNKNKINKR